MRDQPPVSHSLREVASALRAATDAVLRPLGLSVAQYSCLELLAWRPDCSGADVARATHVSRQSTHVLLRAMESDGLVTRRQCRGRALAWRVTPYGASRLGEAQRAVDRIDARVLGAIEAADQERLRGVLEACVDLLADPGPRVTPDLGR